MSLEAKLEMLKQLDAEMLELKYEEDLVSEIQQADVFIDDVYSAIVMLIYVSVPVPVSATTTPRTPTPFDDQTAQVDDPTL